MNMNPGSRKKRYALIGAILLLAAIGLAIVLISLPAEKSASYSVPPLAGEMEYADREEYHVRVDEAGRYESPNPAQKLAFSYVNNAYRVSVGKPTPFAERSAVYRLTALSVNGTPLPLALSPETMTRHNYISQQHGTAFRVDHINTAAGMRQNFVIFSGPAGPAAFQVDLQLETQLQPALAGGNALLLHDPASGEEVLSYKDLQAFDATGKKLAVRMTYEPQPRDDLYAIRLQASGSDLTYPVTIDPLNAAEWSYQRTGVERQITAVAVCDVNGDGKDDLIAGLPRARRDSGQVQVFLANTAGELPVTPSFTINAYQPSTRFGAALACAGDVDGDGYNDLLVGAGLYDLEWDLAADTLASATNRDEGAVFIYYGSATGLDTTFSATNDPVDTIFGQLDTMRLGYSLAGAGDLNNDGIDDILIGAYAYTDPLNPVANAGAVAIYYGADSGIPAATGRTRGIPTGSGAPDKLVQSPSGQREGLFGYSVASAGDLNEDGYQDFMVSAPGESVDTVVGKVHIFFGAPSTSGYTFYRTLPGRDSSGRFGAALAAGDFDGDGQTDIAIGADQEGLGGAIFIYHGTGTGIGNSFAQQLSGPAFSRTGAALAVGNFNGPADTYDDLIAGAPVYTVGQTNEGAALAFYGSDTGLVDSAAWLVESDIESAFFGSALATGDFNGDGADDAAVGAYSLSDSSATAFGGVYAFYAKINCGLPQYGSEPVFLTFPSDIEVSADPGSCGATVVYDRPTGAGDCGATVTRRSGGDSGSSFTVGENKVVFRVTDADGNFRDSTLTITVLDDQNPVATVCPKTLIVNVPTGESTVPVDYDIPTFADNCTLPSGQPVRIAGPDPGESLEPGVYNVQYTATDASDNTATCLFKIIVVGGNSPDQFCKPFVLEGETTLPMELDAEAARLAYERTFSNSLGGRRPNFGMDFLLRIANGLFDKLDLPFKIPGWLIKILGGGGSGIQIGFFRLDFGITPGFDFEYGVYSDIIGSGDATVEANVTTNICVNHPVADYFGCKDTIAISTTQEIQPEGLTLNVDPGELTQDLGLFLADFEVGFSVYIGASVCIGIPFFGYCLGYEPPLFNENISIIPEYNIFEEVYDNNPNSGIIRKSGANYEIALPFLVVCDDFYDGPVPGIGDAVSCASGVGESFSIFQILFNSFEAFQTGAAANPFSYDGSNDELKVTVPSAWSLIPGFPTLPEFGFTFGRLNRDDIRNLPMILGDTVVQLAREPNFQVATLDMLSILDVVLYPILEPVNSVTGPVLNFGTTITLFSGLFTIDLADINMELSNQLIGGYLISPQIVLEEIQLQEPMFYKKGSEASWSTTPSTTIPNVALGEVIQLVIPDYPPTPSPEYDDSAKPSEFLNTNFYDISGAVTVQTVRQANLDIGIRAFEIGGSLFAVAGGTLPPLVNVPVVSIPFERSRVQYQTDVIELRVLDVDRRPTPPMAEWPLEPDDIPAVVTTRDTVLYLNERGLAFLTPASVFNSDPDLSYDPPIGPPPGFPVVVDPSSGTPRGTGKLNLLELMPDTITCEMWPRDAFGQPYFELEAILVVEDDNCNITKEPLIVTVYDTIQPFVTCRDLTVALNPDGYYHLNVDEIAIGALDNCNFVNATVTPSDFSCRDVTPFNLVNGQIVPLDSIDVRVEVEDMAGNYSTCIAKVAVIDTLRYDFGDLAERDDSGVYPTELEDNGARHYVPCEAGSIMLGATLDREPDGRPSLLADGDGDDEDGIVFLTPLIENEIATIQVNAINTTLTKPASLHAFADFNGDGNLTPVNFVTGPPVLLPQTSWTNLQLDFIVPPIDEAEGSLNFRFRLSSDPMAGLPFGPAADGEVEDYSIRLATIGNLVWEDRNYNGLQDVEEIPLGINGVEVALVFGGIRPDGSLDEVGGGQVTDKVLFTTTGPWTRSNGSIINGIYYFTGLIPANYRIEIRDPNPADVIARLRPTIANSGENGTEEDRDSDGLPKEDNPYEVYADFTIADHLAAMYLGTDEEGIGDQDLNLLPYPNEIMDMPDRQVEQRLDFGFTAFDFGDLPDRAVASKHPDHPYDYGTVWAENGARHLVRPDLYLGSCVDPDRNGLPDAEAGYQGNGRNFGDDGASSSGDCVNDEDGVRFLTPLVPGYEACIEITYAAPDNFNGPDAFLKAWADWNGSGAMDEAEQLIFHTLNGRTPPLEPNTNALPLEKSYLNENASRTVRLCFDVPEDATFLEGAAFFRFRLSATNPRFGPTGILPPEANHPEGRVPYGEVEDYFVPLAMIGNLVWEEQNYNWIQDFGNYYSDRERGINGVQIYLIFSGEDGSIETEFNEQKEPVPRGDDRVYATTTTTVEGEDGLYYFYGLIENGAGEEESYQYQLVMVTPENMHPVKPNQPPVNAEDMLDNDLANGSMTDQTIDDLTLVRLNFHIDYGAADDQPLGEYGLADDHGEAPAYVSRDKNHDPWRKFPDTHVNQTFDAGFHVPCRNVASPGEIGYDQWICGPGADPDPIISVRDPYGGEGELEYFWLKKTESNTSGIWDQIPDAKAPDYDPGPLYETTYFARGVRRENCLSHRVSNIVEIVVGDVTAAEIIGPRAVCAGSTVTFRSGGHGDQASIQWRLERYIPLPLASGAGPDFTYTFNSTGLYYLTLTVTEDNCTVTATHRLLVTTNANVCSGSFAIEATAEEESAVRVAWQIPEGMIDRNYTVEYTIDNRRFRAVGTVEQPVGRQDGWQYFEFLHKEPRNGWNRYRVRQEDPNGNAVYSNLADVAIRKHGRLAIAYPNPVGDEWLTVELLEVFQRAITVEVFNLNGKLMTQYEKAGDVRRFELDFSGYPAGLYLIRLRYGDGALDVLRVVKQ